MKTFLYKAIHPKKKIVAGEVKAKSVQDLQIQLKNRNYELISYRLKIIPSSFVCIDKNKTLGEFCYSMAYLLSSGVRLDAALEVILSEESNASFASVLERITLAVQEGSPLSHACALESQLFDDVFLLMTETGEKTGTLSKSFQSLALHYEQTQQLKDKIKKECRYPLFLLGVVFIAIGVIMNFLVPNLVSFLEGMDQELPLATKSLVYTSHVVTEYGFWLMAMLGGIGIVLTILRFHPKYKEKYRFFLERLPLWGRISKFWQKLCYFEILGVLTKSGVPLLHAISLFQQTHRSPSIRSTASYLHQHITMGHSLSESMKSSMFFGASACQIVAVGERSGKLSDAFLYIAKNHKIQLDKEISRLISVIEPTMIVLIGGVLIWVVLGTIYPLYDSFTQIHV